MSEDRDLELGAALRSLPTPEHGPDFWEELEERLAVEARPASRTAARRARWFRPGPTILSLAAAIALVVAAVAVLGGDDGRTRVTTRPSTPMSTPMPPLPPTTAPVVAPRSSYRPGPVRDLGSGLVVGVSADGTAALVAGEDPTSELIGCEGMPAPFLFSAPLDGGSRRRAVPGTTAISGQVLHGPDGKQVAILSDCEEFLSDIVLARDEGNGSLTDVAPLDRSLLDQLASRFSWSRDGTALLGIETETWDVVRIDVRTRTRQPVVAADALQAAELADGTLVLLGRDGSVRTGERDAAGVTGAFGIAVSPDGRQVAAFGADGLFVIAPGSAARKLVPTAVPEATWAPDGGALAYISDGTVSVVTTAGVVSEIARDAVTPGQFTPDGSALVFTGAPSDPEGSAFVVRVVRFE